MVLKSIASLLFCLCVLSATANCQSPTATETSPALDSVLGENVFVFDPSTPSETVNQTLNSLFAKMEANQFGSERYAILFRPGNYDLNFNVGFYTHMAGLGLNPDDVHINGGVNVTAKWLGNANATCNFWRTLENFSVTPSATEGKCRIAVSQAAPLRRLHVKGELHLFDFDDNWNAGWASGGFLADSVVDGQVVPASQQQWFSRNSQWASWSNGVWNMVFVGCENGPAKTSFPEPPYTVVNETPVLREKPFLYLTSEDEFAVFVPALQQNTRGVSWKNGQAKGESIALDKFHVAKPESANSKNLNEALASGKHLLFTPGIYHLEESLRVERKNTIVIGLGVPSLIATTGEPAIVLDDIDGVTIAGLILEAGPKNSPSLLQLGNESSNADHATNPTFLFDITIRTGGPVAGLNDVGITINSDDVVADQLWIWRADHGEGADWTSNRTENGIVINGDDVTIYGLFNEHHEGYQTVWNGNRGRLYFYQSEIPYDVPDQESWMNGKFNGFASYKVGDDVETHEAWGLGVYSYFRDAAVKCDHAIEVPETPGVKIHSMTTVWLNGVAGSEITHVVNEYGGRVYGNSPPEAMRQTWKEFPLKK